MIGFASTTCSCYCFECPFLTPLTMNSKVAALQVIISFLPWVSSCGSCTRLELAHTTTRRRIAVAFEIFFVREQEWTRDHMCVFYGQTSSICHRSARSTLPVSYSMASTVSFWFLPCCRIPRSQYSASVLGLSCHGMALKTARPPGRRSPHPVSLLMFYYPICMHPP